MTYEIRVSPAVVKQLRKLDRQSRALLQGTIESLAEQPRPPRAAKIVGGTVEYRVRAGDFRVLYEIHDRQLLVLVVTIGRRDDVYEVFRRR